MNNAEVLVRSLDAYGVRFIFGVSGGRILPVFQAIARVPGMQLIATRNEQGAAFMADAYARRTGELVCCATTSGPGATNLLTGIAGAYADSVPIIVVTGQAETHEIGHGGIQEGSGIIRSPCIPSLYTQVSKWSFRVGPENDIAAVVQRAVALACQDRPGPVHLDIPYDVLEREHVASPLALVESEIRTDEARAVTKGPVDANGLLKAADLITSARAPLLLIGAGIHTAGSYAALREVQERLALPVVTSLGARGAVDEFHPLSLGMIGCYGQDAANTYLLNESDVVLALGVSFQYLTSISWNPRLREKALIHVDIDARELGKNLKPVITLHGSLSEVLEALLKAPSPPEEKAKARRSNLDRLRSEFGFFPSYRVEQAARSRAGYISPIDALAELQSQVSTDDAIIIDSGENAYWSMFSLRFRQPRQLLSNNAWGAMGYGIAGAVGAAMAATPGTRVFSVCGDGGLMMNVQELSTAAQHQLPCTWLLLDNGCYGTQRHWQRDWHNGVFIGTEMPPIDYASLAQSLGVLAMAVSSVQDLGATLQAARSAERPSLVWLRIDPDVKPPQAIGSTLKK